MSSRKAPIARTVRGVIDRLFETLERAQLKDVERTLAGAANPREVSQRVHRLEAGDKHLF